MPSSPHAIRVGANVRAERARLNISQTAFAERLNITQQALSRRESGQQAFRVDELHEVAEALGVSVGILMGEEPARAAS
jgi:transcriptional regulator with XRE-family HTH domain